MTHTFNWQKLKIPFDYSISFRCKDGIETIKHNCFGKQQCAVTFGIISITVLFFFLFLQKLLKNLSIVSLFKKYHLQTFLLATRESKYWFAKLGKLSLKLAW